MNSKILISTKVKKEIHTPLLNPIWHGNEAIAPVKPLAPVGDQIHSLSHEPHLNILVMAKYGFAIIATILGLITLTIIVLFCLYVRAPAEEDV